MVLGDDGPVITEQLNVTLTSIDHGLDGEYHAFFQLYTGAGFAIVQDLGVFVEAFADAMSTVFTDDREIVRFGMLLDSMPDITQVGARPYQLDTQFHAFMGNLADTFSANRWFADVKHFAGIAVIAIFYDGDIDIDDIALLQFLLTGDAVAYLVNST